MHNITMDDVAKKASVSVATVSRVYTNPDKVSLKNRQKVLKAIEELNYQPNVLARNLRRLQTNTILVIIPNIINTFFTYMLKSIQHTAIEHGYQILLGDTNRSPELEQNYIHLLQQKWVDGVILLFPRLELELLESLADQKPVVVVGRLLSNINIPCVTNDNTLSTRIATEHLIQLGHRRIAYLSGTLGIHIADERLAGYFQAIEEYGLTMDESLILEGDYYVDSGYELALELLSQPEVPTAIVAASDEMAIGAMKAARELGISIPDQLAIIGFDDIKMASMCEPPLSTMAQSKEEFGRISTEMLLALIKGDPIPNTRIILNDELVIRKSCGAYLKK
jgi:LacI family transcriptional regulator, repressor for deo operon, udp, cdd, tsx, nupC, and nupG